MRICLFEDQQASYLEPLASTRPVFELICGQTSLAAKQLNYFAAEEYGVVVRPQLAGLYRQEHPAIAVNDCGWVRQRPTVMVNGRWLPPTGVYAAAEPHVGLIGDEVAYAQVGKGQWCDCLPETMAHCVDNWKETLPHCQAPGVMIHYPWDLVEHNARQLQSDFEQRQRGRPSPMPAGVAVLGPRDNLRLAPTARVEPMVVIDVTGGPVAVDEGAVVTAFTRIEGPCYIGRQTHIMSARIRAGCSFGPQCRIGGEVEASVIHGHSNKYHEGFLGHAYVGEWVNLGAGTHNSDLRNDYGEVSVPLLQTPIKTGLSKVGCFVGDHTKTGLGTLINTGTSIGVFANLLPAGTLVPKFVPPFSIWWKGKLQEAGDLNQLLATAGKVMARRGKTLTEAHMQLYQQLFDDTALLRLRAMQEPDRRRRPQSA